MITGDATFSPTKFETRWTGALPASSGVKEDPFYTTVKAEVRTGSSIMLLSLFQASANFTSRQRLLKTATLFVFTLISTRETRGIVNEMELNTPQSSRTGASPSDTV